MAVRLNPYLSFQDTAKDAMTFYQSVFGGELTMSSFGEFQVSEDPAEQDKIMHGMLVADNGLVLMGADTPNSMELGANGTLSLSGEDESVLRGYWEKLIAGGVVAIPLEQAPWGDFFGQCKDKFGVDWMVNITGTPAG